MPKQTKTMNLNFGPQHPAAQEGNGHEIVTYINSNKEKLSQNIDLEKSYKKLTKMVSTMKN